MYEYRISNVTLLLSHVLKMTTVLFAHGGRLCFKCWRNRLVDMLLSAMTSKRSYGKDSSPYKFGVQGVSLAWPNGVCLGILGPINGAGKSSFISMHGLSLDPFIWQGFLFLMACNVYLLVDAKVLSVLSYCPF
jgi:hypothetical protein